jgi:undecaprenyl diphosphate synthase
MTVKIIQPTDKVSLETREKLGLQGATLPRHIAIIMDGNGRWARQRTLTRIKGHQAAAQSVRETVETCARLGIQYLTLYAFSTENWERPKREVEALMRLLKDFLVKERDRMLENNIQLNVIGRTDKFTDSLREEMQNTIEATSVNDRLILTLALNYGGRQEIIDATKKIAREVAEQKLDPAQIDEQTITSHLDTADMPDPDLLIRTSGEFRVSNFLLWQISYSEIYITDVLWPDFRKGDLAEAIKEFSTRERRYGKVKGPHA